MERFQSKINGHCLRWDPTFFIPFCQQHFWVTGQGPRDTTKQRLLVYVIMRFAKCGEHEFPPVLVYIAIILYKTLRSGV